MEIDLNNVTFDKNDMDHLKDCIFNVLSEYNISNEEAMLYWKKLPDDIKFDALEYGISDTPTREKIYEWLSENREQLKKDSENFDNMVENLGSLSDNDIWKPSEKTATVRLLPPIMNSDDDAWVNAAKLILNNIPFNNKYSFENNPEFSDKTVKVVSTKILDDSKPSLQNEQNVTHITVSKSLEETVLENGFDSLQDFYKLVSNADISTPEKIKNFNNWQDNDGTKEGLLNLNKSADIYEKDLNIYDVFESPNGNLFIKLSDEYSIAIGNKGNHNPTEIWNDLKSTQYVKCSLITPVKKVGKIIFD